MFDPAGPRSLFALPLCSLPLRTPALAALRSAAMKRKNTAVKPGAKQRSSYSREQKLEAIRLAKKEGSAAKAVRILKRRTEFAGLDASMISRWKKKEQEIEDTASAAKRQRAPRHPRLEKALLHWLAFRCERGLRVDRAILCIKAKRVAEELEPEGITEFSKSWATRFLKRCALPPFPCSLSADWFTSGMATRIVLHTVRQPRWTRRMRMRRGSGCARSWQVTTRRTSGTPMKRRSSTGAWTLFSLLHALTLHGQARGDRPHLHARPATTRQEARQVTPDSHDRLQR